MKLSILRHLWYLTELLVVFSLATTLSMAVKREMADVLRQTPRHVVFGQEKPRFPIQLIQDANTGLPQLIGPRSWLLFDLLHAEGAWLNRPPHQWVADREYEEMRLVVGKLAVVNYAAERGVKDITDYANGARDGSSRERIVLVANSHRIQIPQFLKHEMQEQL